MQAELYWIWLALLPLSPRARAALIGAYGSAEAVFRAKAEELRALKGVSAKEAEALEDHSLEEAKRSLGRCDDQGIDILPVTSPDYPERLRQIWAPPAVLFVQGRLPAVDELPVLSVIGTRRASPYGIRMGQKVAGEISRCGGTVLSLLTTGVDEAAAQGALRANGVCIAVLGTPHEQDHSPLRRKILETGAILSEYPPGKKTFRHFFRERNRIAAGLSVGVVVIEAPELSGTRLFVTDAVEQGKDIFAVPGNADAENAAGTLSLLKEGAKLVTCGADVMEEYELRFPELVRLDLAEEGIDADASDGSAEAAETDTSGPGSAEAGESETTDRPGKGPGDPAAVPEISPAVLAALTEEQRSIVGVLRAGTLHVDDIIEKTGLGPAKVLAQLTVLEIRDLVRREPGRFFSLKGANQNF